MMRLIFDAWLSKMFEHLYLMQKEYYHTPAYPSLFMIHDFLKRNRWHITRSCLMVIWFFVFNF